MWDVKTVSDTNTNSDATVFQKVSSLRRSGIEIKYGNTISSGDSVVKQIKNEEQKVANPYGKWEPVSTDKKDGDLNKYMKLCQEVSAKESIYEDHVVDSKASSDEEDDRIINHPFISKPAPIVPPVSFSSRIPMVGYIEFHFQVAPMSVEPSNNTGCIKKSYTLNMGAII